MRQIGVGVVERFLRLRLGCAVLLTAFVMLAQGVAWPQSKLATVTAQPLSTESTSVGSVVTLSAAVTQAGAAVTRGSVTFLFGSTPVATVPLVVSTHSNGDGTTYTAGTAYYRLRPAAGSYTVTARYNGTSGYAASTSSSLALEVGGKNATSTALTDSKHGTTGYDFTAKVTGLGAAGPTGTLTLSDPASGTMATGTLAALPASFTPINEYATFYSIGEAVADFNQDGVPDLAVADHDNYKIKLYSGSIDSSGNYVLSSTPASYSTSACSPSHVVAGDFNGDGFPDLAVTCDGGSAVLIYLNDGTGVLGTPASVTVSSSSQLYGIVAGEFTHSGSLDLAVADTANKHIQVLTNNGSGTFTLGNSITVSVAPYEVISDDFNGDGYADLACTMWNSSSSYVQVFINDGSGGFTALTAYATGSTPWALASGDLNGDGLPDLVAVNNAGQNVTVLLNTSNSTQSSFQTGTTVSLPSGTYPSAVVIADFNGDGYNDLAVAGMGNDNLYYLAGAGDGTFASPVATALTGSGPTAMVSADFDGSGSRDLAVLNGSNYTLDLVSGANSSTVSFSNIVVIGASAQKVTAKYVPATGSVYSTSQASVTLSPVASLAATVQMSASPGTTLTYGQQLLATVTVMGVSGEPVPTGNITCQFDTAACVGSNLSGGVAALDSTTGSVVLDFSTVTAGLHTISISYNGDSLYLGTSTPLTQSITVNQASPAITWSAPSAITYGTPLSAAQLNASTTVAGVLTYSPPDGTVMGAGTSQTLSVTFVPTDTNDYKSVTATVPLTVNLDTSSVTLVASSLSAAAGSSITLSALVVPANGGTATGSVNFYNNSSTLLGSGLLDAVGTGQCTIAGLAAGSYLVTAVYAGDSNVNGSTSTILTLTMTSTSQATPVITWATPTAITYGTALSATQLNATAADPGSGATVAGSFAYTPAAGVVPTAGNKALYVLFTPADTTTYTTASASVLLAVNKDASTVALTTSAASIAANGSAVWTAVVTADNGGSATGDVSFYTAGSTLQGTATLDATGTAVWTASGLAVGSYQVTAVYAGDSNVTSSTSAAISQTVTSTTLATPVIAWATPAAITYGTTLGSAQLDATASDPTSGATVDGTFVYTPPAGTLLVAGTKTLQVSFTPADSGTYTTAGKSVSLTVSKAGSTVVLGTSSASIIAGNSVTWTAAVTPLNGGSATGNVGFYTGTTLVGTSILNTSGVATWSVTGLGVGSYQVTAVYAGDSNVTGSTSAALTQTVTSSTLLTPVISWATPGAITYGTALSSTQLDASATNPNTGATVAGSFAYTPSLGAVLTAGIQTLGVLFTPADTATYTTASKSVLLTVNKDSSTITLKTSSASIVVGGSATWTATVATSGGEIASGTVNFYTAGTTLEGSASLDATGAASFVMSGLAVGTYSVTAVYTGDSNVSGGTSAAISQAVTSTGGSGTPDYSLSANPATVTVVSGATGTSTITVTPTGNLDTTLTLGCSGLPTYSSCTFSPATLSANGSDTVLTSSLSLATAETPSARIRSGHLWLALALWTLPLGALFLRGRRRWLLPVCLLPLLLASMLSCGGGGGGGGGGNSHKTPAGTYTIQVTAAASSGNVSSRSTSMTLVVTD